MELKFVFRLSASLSSVFEASGGGQGRKLRKAKEPKAPTPRKFSRHAVNSVRYRCFEGLVLRRG